MSKQVLTIYRGGQCVLSGATHSYGGDELVEVLAARGLVKIVVVDEDCPLPTADYVPPSAPATRGTDTVTLDEPNTTLESES